MKWLSHETQQWLRCLAIVEFVTGAAAAVSVAADASLGVYLHLYIQQHWQVDQRCLCQAAEASFITYHTCVCMRATERREEEPQSLDEKKAKDRERTE